MRSERACRVIFGLAVTLAGSATSGCRGSRDSADGEDETPSRTPTFAQDVAPLVHRQCSPCHRPGGAGPFDLLSYDDVKDHATQIVEVTQSGFMPPWLPEPGHGRFVGERVLSSTDKQMLREWVEAEAPRGDPAKEPEPPSFAGGWQLGEPDVVLAMDEPFTVPADGLDVYRNFVIHVPPGPTRFVRAVELRPGDPRVVHHAVVRIDTTGDAARLDAGDETPGFDGMVVDAGRMPDGRFIGWTPGKAVDPGSRDRAWTLPGGADLVVQLHLRPTGKPEIIRSEIGLYLAEGPPTRRALAMELSSLDIDLPPGEGSVRVTDTYELPVDASVLSVYPHAHYLGKQLHGYAILPDGSKRWLVKIDDWDFNWQDQYRFVDPVRLPAGTVVHMDYRYDNSADNPHNPFDPPRHVVHGPSSTDEMAELILEIEPADPRHLELLDRDFMRKWLSVQATELQRRLKKDPEDAEALAGLAALRERMGEHEEALQLFARAVNADPERADTRIDHAISLQADERWSDARAELVVAAELAPGDPRVALTRANLERKAGSPKAAIEHYRRAIELEPTLAEAHNNLAITYEDLGQLANAEAAMQEVLKLSPGQAKFQLNLARIREARGDGAGAVAVYRQVLEQQPRSLQAMRGLAWILATDADEALRDPAQALQIAQVAAQATQNRAPQILDALAAAHAAQGRFELAARILETAVAQAKSVNDAELERDLQSRLKLYRAGKPYHSK